MSTSAKQATTAAAAPARHFATAPLTEEQIRLVKATAPVFKEHGKTITTYFYKRMLGNHPELNNIFNQAHQRTGAQPTALANAVFAYAANIDNLGMFVCLVASAFAHSCCRRSVKSCVYHFSQACLTSNQARPIPHCRRELTC